MKTEVCSLDYSSVYCSSFVTFFSSILEHGVFLQRAYNVLLLLCFLVCRLGLPSPHRYCEVYRMMVLRTFPVRLLLAYFILDVALHGSNWLTPR